MKQIFPTILIWTGMVAIVIGLIMPLFTGPQDAIFRWVFGFGAVLNLVGRLFSPYTGTHLRVKRLGRIELWAALFLRGHLLHVLWLSAKRMDCICACRRRHSHLHFNNDSYCSKKEISITNLHTNIQPYASF